MCHPWGLSWPVLPIRITKQLAQLITNVFGTRSGNGDPGPGEECARPEHEDYVDDGVEWIVEHVNQRLRRRQIIAQSARRVHPRLLTFLHTNYKNYNHHRLQHTRLLQYCHDPVVSRDQTHLYLHSRTHHTFVCFWRSFTSRDNYRTNQPTVLQCLYIIFIAHVSSFKTRLSRTSFLLPQEKLILELEHETALKRFELLLDWGLLYSTLLILVLWRLSIAEPVYINHWPE